ncbi:extracellular solute-binding protein [Neobacillus kokaensis]|uniref:ABC transporter substrate-binding protein n=1 Tax=Neobacillus kokaensis TaxID=2759023 RepID=A0ABQ3N508_9BACI|nr:extracellular solute-binding protein [Neobacillus kokaensis]GHI00026.1 hypothetical protein AM1BK_35680 [Neobacillus kokaensis]
MKRSRKWLMCILVLSMLFVTACSMFTGKKATEQKDESKAENSIDNGKFKEPVMMTIAKPVNPQDKSLPSGDTIDNNILTRYVTDKTNVKFKATLTGASGDSYNQKMQVAIASNNIPDAMIVTEKQLRQLVEADMIEDLTDVYKNYAGKFMKDVYESGNNRALENATFDGKLMAIPDSVFERDTVSMLWIRQDWLDKLGLTPPKTLDDIEKVAKAFIEQDPDGNGKADTIGLTGTPYLFGSHGFDSIFSAVHAYPDFWVKDDSGKVVHGSVTPETKKGLEKLREWYKEGIIDKEFALRKDPNELVAGGKAGLFFGPWWSPWGGPIADAVKINPKADWKAYTAPLDENGEFNGKMTNISNTYAVVRKGYQHPEALMLVLNAEFSGNFSNLTNDLNPSYTPVRLVADWSDAVTRRVKQFEQYLDGNKDTSQMDYETKRLLPLIEQYAKNPTADLSTWQPAHSYMEGGKTLLEPMNEVRSLFYSQTKTMEAKWTTISKLQSETFLKIIMGREPVNSFDKYVKQFNELGGDVITKEVEEAINK